jgi:hypothetical protein
MKKISIITILFAFVSTIIFFSCSNETDNKDTKSKISLRSDFLGKKTYQEMKTNFDKLKFEDKINLWESKIDQLLSQKLPQEHIELIKKIQIEYKKANILESNSLKETLLRLAEITPEKDFIEMFMDLKDYNFSGSFEKVTNLDALTIYLEECDYQYSQTINSKVAALPDCNCNYSCTAQTINPHVCSSSNCAPTIDGCGPFGMSSCDGRVYIC